MATAGTKKKMTTKTTTSRKASSKKPPVSEAPLPLGNEDLKTLSRKETLAYYKSRAQDPIPTFLDDNPLGLRAVPATEAASSFPPENVTVSSNKQGISFLPVLTFSALGAGLFIAGFYTALYTLERRMSFPPAKDTAGLSLLLPFTSTSNSHAENWPLDNSESSLVVSDPPPSPTASLQPQSKSAFQPALNPVASTETSHVKATPLNIAENSQTASTVKETATPLSETSVKKPLISAFALELSTHSSEAEARAAAANYTEKGLDTYIIVEGSGSKSVYKLRVGFYSDFDPAYLALRDIFRDYQVSAKVVKTTSNDKLLES